MKVLQTPLIQTASYQTNNPKKMSPAKAYNATGILECEKTVPSFPNILPYFNITFKGAMKEHLGQGARYLGNGETKFTITAPYSAQVSVSILKNGYEKDKSNVKVVDMTKDNDKFEVIADAQPGDKYFYTVRKADGFSKEIYDPRSDYLPFDIDGYRELSGLSEIIDHSEFEWSDKEWMQNRKSYNQNQYGWSFPDDMIVESLHIGTLDGFKEAKKELDNIEKLGGVNAVRIMPVGEFYGRMNWGYDEVCKFAVENAYGTPEDFKEFIDYAHTKGLQVILDVVPNHFGPKGNIVQEIMPAYSDHHTEWGKALEFDGLNGKYMRSYMTDMMMNWAVNYHVDGFRIDATHFMGSDDALLEIIRELRGHEETQNLIIYPEDMRMSRTMANANMAKEVSKQNYGFDGMTTFDFFKALITNATNQVKHDWHPNLLTLEETYKKGIVCSHEEKMLNMQSITPKEREQCLENLKLPPSTAANYLVNISNHDEIGNLETGKRNLVSILSSRLNMNDRCYGNWKNATHAMFELIKSYSLTGAVPPEVEQIQHGCLKPVSKGEFENELRNSMEINKLIIGAMFMHPSPKEFFMGDSYGELSPFKFFCELPDYDDDIMCSIADTKGYMPDKSAFEESKTRQEKYNIAWVQEGTEQFFKDFAQLFKDSKPLQTGDFNKIRTYSYPNEKILEVTRLDDNGNQIIALMNFSDKGYPKFKLNTVGNTKLTEKLNSNAHKYNSSGNFVNSDSKYNGEISVPPYGIVVLSTGN